MALRPEPRWVQAANRLSGLPVARRGFFRVVRFLSYLDLRIRHEGWEVELLMRAESLRLGMQVE